jgi:hypothetical protein
MPLPRDPLPRPPAPRLATMGNEVEAPAVKAFVITFNGRITPTGN